MLLEDATFFFSSSFTNAVGLIIKLCTRPHQSGPVINSQLVVGMQDDLRDQRREGSGEEKRSSASQDVNYSNKATCTCA